MIKSISMGKVPGPNKINIKSVKLLITRTLSFFKNIFEYHPNEIWKCVSLS